MEQWESYQAKAIAIFPFEALSSHQLSLVVGDRLQVLERCGDWIRVHCETTSCLGICPLSYVKIIDEASEYELLTFEAQKMLHYLFKYEICNSVFYNPTDAILIDFARTILSGLPVNYESKFSVSGALDEIRKILKIRRVQRNDNKSIISIHDVNISNFVPEKQEKSIFPSTSLIELHINISYPKDVKIIAYLIDVTKSEIIAQNQNIILPSQFPIPQIFTFANLDSRTVKDLVMFLDIYKISGKQTVYEIIGNSCIHVSKWAKTGPSTFYDVEIYPALEALPLDKKLEFVNMSKSNSIQIESIGKLDINILIKESPGQSLTNFFYTQPIKFPVNTGPQYKSGILRIRYKNLKMNSWRTKQYSMVTYVISKRMKKETIISNSLDMLQQRSTIFSGTPNELEAVTISLRPNEYFAEHRIVIKLELFDVKRFTFSVVAGTVIPLMNSDGTAGFDWTTIQLYQIPPEISDVVKAVDPSNHPKPAGTIEVIMENGTTWIPANPTVAAVKRISEATPSEEVYATISDIIKLDQLVLRVHMDEILDRLLSVVVSNEDQLPKTVLAELCNVIDADRSGILKFCFDAFVEKHFTANERNEYVRCLDTHILKFVWSNLPETFTNETIETCKSTIRALPYLLTLTLRSMLQQVSQKTTKENTKQQIVHIFSRIMSLIDAIHPEAIVIKGFVVRAFPMLCEIIAMTDIETAPMLAGIFLERVSREKNLAIVKLRRKMYAELCQTKLFKDESARAVVIPKFMESLEAESDDAFESDVMPTLMQLFFVLMRSCTNLSSSLMPFVPYFTRILRNNPHFCITMLYFGDSNFAESVILDSEDRCAMFFEILDSIRQAVNSQPPSYIFFTCGIAFVHIMKCVSTDRFDFLRENLSFMIQNVAGFITDFINELSNMHKFDAMLYSSMYCVDLNPIAAQIPALLTMAPAEAAAKSDVAIPLFHFFLTQADPATKKQVADAFALMATAEWKQSESFDNTIKAALRAFVAVDHTMSIKPLNELLDIAANQIIDTTNAPKAYTFIKKLMNMHQMVVSLGLLASNRENEDELTEAVLKLLDYAKEMNDSYLQIHFLTVLFELHSSLGHKYEAGEACISLAKILNINETNPVSMLEFEPMTPFKLFMELCSRAAELFAEEYFYDRALVVLKRQKSMYQERHMNAESDVVFKRITEVSILQEGERPTLSRFYGATFYKNGQPSVTYLYRRGPYFMNDQMVSELQQKYSLEVTHKPLSDKMNYIYVFNVKPKDFDTFLDPMVPRSFDSSCEFISETPIFPEVKPNLPECAVVSMRIATYKTQPLPGISRRWEAEGTPAVVTLSPIENAIASMNAKSMELLATSFHFWRRIQFNSTPETDSLFIMTLNGMVHAGVNGGSSVYIDTFLVRLADDPEVKKHKDALVKALKDQMRVIRFAIIIHRQIMQDSSLALHRAICEGFEKVEEELAKNPVIGAIDYEEQILFGAIPPYKYTTFCLNSEE